MNRLTILIAAFMCLAMAAGAQTEPDMVKVDGGTFKMGSAVKGDADERPVHTVTVNSFLISKYELSVKEYKQFISDKSATDFLSKREHVMPAAPDTTWMKEHPDTQKFYPLASVSWGGWQDNFPMHHITWYDAVAYCNWLSEKHGLQKCYSEDSDGTVLLDISKNGYRLPTEAEWEFAAKGGNKSRGTDFAGSSNPETVCWYDDTSMLEGPQKIGSKEPNELGIYDMSGNVIEWCQDRYGESYYEDWQVDPQGPGESGAGYANENFVLRGGDYLNSSYPEYCEVADRNKQHPNVASEQYGMRLAL